MNLTFIDPLAKLLGEWSYELCVWSVVFRIGISFLFSAAIGYERAHKRHAAGLRTFLLVSVACTVAMLIDSYLVQAFGASAPWISAASVVGIAIVSSYSILYNSKSQIKGLTTAIALWTTSLLGLSIGAGFYTVGVALFIVLFSGLSMLPALEVYLKNRSNHFEIQLELTNKTYLQDFIATIRKLGLRIDEIESNPAYLNSGLSVYTIALTIHGEELKKYKTHSEIIEALNSLDYVSYAEEIQ